MLSMFLGSVKKCIKYGHIYTFYVNVLNVSIKIWL